MTETKLPYITYKSVKDRSTIYDEKTDDPELKLEKDIKKIEEYYETTEKIINIYINDKELFKRLIPRVKLIMLKVNDIYDITVDLTNNYDTDFKLNNHIVWLDQEITENLRRIHSRIHNITETKMCTCCEDDGDEDNSEEDNSEGDDSEGDDSENDRSGNDRSGNDREDDEETRNYRDEAIRIVEDLPDL
jgi:hypothetical protein